MWLMKSVFPLHAIFALDISLGVLLVHTGKECREKNNEWNGQHTSVTCIQRQRFHSNSFCLCVSCWYLREMTSFSFSLSLCSIWSYSFLPCYYIGKQNLLNIRYCAYELWSYTCYEFYTIYVLFIYFHSWLFTLFSLRNVNKACLSRFG